MPTIEEAIKLADQDCPLPSLAGPALKLLRDRVRELEAGALRQQLEAFGGYVIQHADGSRWRTLDSIGMPDWTDVESEALRFGLRKHADAFAGEDPEDVRIVPAPSEPVKVPEVRVTTQGVAFGRHCWYSHERITGLTADELNSGKGNVTARAYMEWVQSNLAAALGADGAAA